MQLLKSISEHLLTRPPQPPSESSEPIELPPSPPSNAASSSERPLRNALAPRAREGSNTDTVPDKQPSHAHAPRYDNSFRPDRKPGSVRRVLRQSIPHPGLGLGMPKPPREREPTRGSATSSTTFADELRLFPGGKQQDPDGVQVVPGQTFGKKANIPTGFKPWDTISRGAKSSGPIRASGRPKSFFSSQSRPATTEDPERSSKRRRVESPEARPRRISISDDEVPDRSSIRESPVATRTNAQSPSPSPFSDSKRRKGLSNGRGSEYRTTDESTRVSRRSPKKSTSYLDRFSSEDQDISFTRNAAKQRRRESNGEEAPRKPPAQTSNLSVEILNISNGTTKSSTSKGRPSYSRESSDELQGEVTVGPVPTSLENSTDKHPSSDIRPTVFISQQKSKRGRGKKEKGSKKGPKSQTFALVYYRGGAFLRENLEGDNDRLTIDPRNGDSGELTISIADSGYIHSISLPKVRKAVVGEAPSRKVRFELSKVEGGDTKLDFELSSAEEKKRLCSFLDDLTIEVKEKEGDYIDNAFKKGIRDHVNLAQSNGHKRPLALVEVTEDSHKQPPGQTKRKKLSDALQDKEKEISAQPDSKSRSRHASPSLPATENNSKRASSPVSGPQRSVGVEIPVKKSSTLLQAPTRATRSMSRQNPMTVVDDDDDGQEEEHTPQPDLAVDQKWNRKPLLYPRFGKKKAEVNALDLERLAPNEFLNDNIIGFYIRFLEDHLQRCNAEVAKRVYFFNSYFFATLTNSPRSRRSINYEGVEKWTRNVDLFSYDYIIVPINEHAHWYIAIIANLPQLEGVIEESKEPTIQPPNDVQEVPETPEPESQKDASDKPQSKEETARQSLASMSLLDPGSQPEGSKSGDDEWPEREENSDVGRVKLSEASSQPQPDSQKDSETAGTPKKPRKNKRKQSLGMRYDISQPIVITFDSLNQSRSSTISTLREYLFAEAKSKRGIEINKTLVKGMTAKEIPQQPNYSDCGLYLLAYVEKFVQNPDLFVRKLLRREMCSKKDWPPLRSGLLRSRLHRFMEQLYSEQEQLTKVKADGEKLMVDQQPISYLLGTPVADGNKKEDDDQKAPEPQIQVEHSPPPKERSRSKSKTPIKNRDSSARSSPEPNIERDANEQKAEEEEAGPGKPETQESVVCIEPPAPQPKSPTLKEPTRSKGVVVEVPDSQEAAKIPADEPAQEVETRSAELRKQDDTVYVDDSDGVEKSAPPEQKRAGLAVQVQVSGTPPKSR